MSIFLQLLVNGLIASSLYALLAGGFSLIHSVTKTLHFAHGAVFTSAAYATFLLTDKFGLNFFLAIIFALIFSTFLGLIIDKLVYQPFRNRKASLATLLIVSLVLLTILNAVFLAIFGSSAKILSISSGQSAFDIFARITATQIAAIITSLVLIIGLFIILKRTKIGKALRATADNPSAAQIVGISPNVTFSIAFLIGSFLASVAGILAGTELNIYPEMGSTFVVKAFTASVIGGIGSVPGAVLGGLFLGTAENFGIWV